MKIFSAMLCRGVINVGMTIYQFTTINFLFVEMANVRQFLKSQSVLDEEDWLERNSIIVKTKNIHVQVT